MRVGASATQVPPFALFELVASQTGSASRANNAKSGTSLVASGIVYQGTGTRFWHTRSRK